MIGINTLPIALKFYIAGAFCTFENEPTEARTQHPQIKSL